MASLLNVGRALVEKLPDYVDLGLPSGLLWAQGNIIKNANGVYAVGEPTDYGCHFSWGNIEGHNDGDGYNFGTTDSGPYVNTPGASVNTDISPTDADHDAALACLGSPWHLPTKDDFQELYDNTDRECATINNVSGWKFMKKTDNSVYVFIPTAGYGYGTSVNWVGRYGHCWLSSWRSTTHAYGIGLGNSSTIPRKDRYNRYYGFSVRAVRSSN